MTTTEVPSRNPALERDLFQRSTIHLSDHPDYRTLYMKEARERLDAQEAAGADGWRKPLPEIAGEMTEEGVDVGCWGVGIDLRLAAEVPDEIVRAQLRQRLIQGIAYATLSWREITELSRMLPR